jgi:hypothetical protein
LEGLENACQKKGRLPQSQLDMSRRPAKDVAKSQNAGNPTSRSGASLAGGEVDTKQ